MEKSINNLNLRSMSKSELLDLKQRIDSILRDDEECSECGHPNNRHGTGCVAVE